MKIRGIIAFFLGLALGVIVGWFLCLHRDHKIAAEYKIQEKIQAEEMEKIRKNSLELGTMGRDIDWFIHLLKEQENLVINWNKDAIKEPEIKIGEE